MFNSMNRYKIAHGQEEAYETIWKTRETKLDAVKEFKEFRLLKGPEREDHTLYASHTIWASQDAFLDWTKSEAFRNAHRNAGDNKGVYLGHPEFEGFEPVMEQIATAKA